MHIKKFIIPLGSIALLLNACGDSTTATAQDDGIENSSTETIYTCSDGSLTKDASDCVSETTEETVYTCNDGSTVTDETLCTSGVAETSTTTVYVCTDGSKVTDASDCVSETTETTTYVCTDGTTTTNAEDCVTTSNEDNSTSSSSKKAKSSSSDSSDDNSSETSSSSEAKTASEIEYAEASGNITLTFSNSGLTVDNDDNSCVTVDDNNKIATINCAGNYYLSGTSSNYQVVVAINSDSAKAYLYLNGLDLTSTVDAPFYVQSAEKVFFVLSDGTTNKVTDASTRTKTWSYTKNGNAKVDTTGAAIYAKDDITFKGNGSLTITGNYNNGIHTTNDLRIKDTPTITVTAANHAIKGKGSVKIEGGTYTLTATSGDGIKSDEGEDEETVTTGKGVIIITGGTFNIIAGDDGIQSYNYTLFADSVSTPKITINATEKGIVSSHSIYVNAGVIDVTSNDDCIHSDLNIYFNGGETTLTGTVESGCSNEDHSGYYCADGVHADSSLRINNGSIYVKKAYEGFEGWYIYANGGKTAVITSDDGWNAAGGSRDESSSSSSQQSSHGGQGGNQGMGGGVQSKTVGYIEIHGGYHYIYASGNDVDVLDANGTATMDAGVVILELGSSSGNGGSMGGGMGSFGGGSSSGTCSTNESGGLIDTDKGFTITGGVLLGFGSQTEEYPNCTATSYTAGTYYGSSNAAFAPQGSGSMIIYGGEVTSVNTVSTSGMTAITLPNGMTYYEK